MAYVTAMGECVNCGQLFSFNPYLVPSVRVSRKDGRWVPDPNGSREPMCGDCVTIANRKRREAGVPQIKVLPGAYEPQECA